MPESIRLDVNELAGMDKVEQAQHFEQLHRQIDGLLRSSADDPRFLKWAEQQRRYLTRLQQRIFF
jgi:hypothetical protein